MTKSRLYQKETEMEGRKKSRHAYDLIPSRPINLLRDPTNLRRPSGKRQITTPLKKKEGNGTDEAGHRSGILRRLLPYYHDMTCSGGELDGWIDRWACYIAREEDGDLYR